MIGLPVAVWYWWSRSSKYSGEQVLLDTTQLYYYFFHKTPHMMLRRVLMVLGASLEFERGHNSEIMERPTDNAEIPQLMKSLPNLGINNKEKPLCFGYSVKARALLFAHLSRIPLPKHTLHQDRLYIIKKCAYLIHEMVSCLSQLILLAHAGRIARLPSLDTVEATMKCSVLVVQALWDKASPLMQLPHVEEDMLKHFYSKRRNIKSLKQLAMMADDDRRSLLRSFSDDQYKDLVRVLGGFPHLSMTVITEVVDDEKQHVVTAGSIITVTIRLERNSLDMYLGSLGDDEEVEEKNNEDQEMLDDEEDDAVDKEAEEKEDEKKKGPVWKKPQQKKKPKKAGKGGKQKQKTKTKTEAGTGAAGTEQKEGESGSDSEGEDSGSDDSGSERGEKGDKSEREKMASEDDEEEQEWARFQRGVNKREKALSGKSRVSHSVHSPYFTDDKQEFWWVYISDRKSHSLITPPYHLTSLVTEEEVELKFTAPSKEGIYNFTVCVRSDSYLGTDLMDDIKLDVQKAWEAPTEHKQWEFSDDEADDDDKDASEESEFAEDSEFEDDSD